MSSPIRTVISLCGRGYTQDDPAILECVQRNGGGRILKRFSNGVNAVLVHPCAQELDLAKKRKLEEYQRLGFPVIETRSFRSNSAAANGTNSTASQSPKPNAHSSAGVRLAQTQVLGAPVQSPSLRYQVPQGHQSSIQGPPQSPIRLDLSPSPTTHQHPSPQSLAQQQQQQQQPHAQQQHLSPHIQGQQQQEQLLRSPTSQPLRPLPQPRLQSQPQQHQLYKAEARAEGDGMVMLDIVPINGNKFQVRSSLDTCVGDLKRVVAGRSGIPAAQQRLVYSGQELKVANRTLSQAGIGRHGNFAIHLVQKATSGPGDYNSGPGARPQAKPVIVIDDVDLQEINQVVGISRQASSGLQDGTIDLTGIDFQGTPEIRAPSRKRKARGAASSRNNQPPPEKRLTRYRTNCPVAVMQRIARAKTQRLFLIDQKDQSREGFLSRTFAVMGSTGNIYNVAIEQKPRCDCPDFAKGNLCKHILFVYLKVLRQPDHCSHIYQTSLLQCELKGIFDTSPKSLNGCLARKEVISAYKKVKGEGEDEEDENTKGSKDDMRLEKDCPVCFEEIVEGGRDALVYCRDGCKKALHKQCQEMW
eukprot:CAMPEP_0117753528 /NCGR_PEP_ID=MMETSP0947-20121206/12280_1 /TAXON_ID=44440 /ORGANISM="Chattonella subsalsa, Strain CCMP2191" /LENGTH=584 /DNA_ID=CAMNT_0005572429 /DNA_START=126 /DNA_END=1877 /DNA_ORIENTATION=+